jgi:hypothetical protein
MEGNKMFNWMFKKVANAFGSSEPKRLNLSAQEIIAQVSDDQRLVKYLQKCISLNYYNQELFNEIYQKYLEKKQAMDYFAQATNFINGVPEAMSAIGIQQLKMQRESSSTLNDISFRQYTDLANRNEK